MSLLKELKGLANFPQKKYMQQIYIAVKTVPIGHLLSQCPSFC